jgi:hypothetical protein
LDARGVERKLICGQLRGFSSKVILMMSAWLRLIRFKGMPLILVVAALLAGWGASRVGHERMRRMNHVADINGRDGQI